MAGKITLAKAKENIEKADKLGQANWREEAYESYRLYNGYQWPDADSAKMRAEGRPNVAFNRVAPIVDAMIGMELANRKEIKYYPRTVARTFESDMMQSIATWIRQESGQEIAEVDAERDMFICGIGCTDTRMNYEDSELGDLDEERINPLHQRYDPYARKRNLRDRKWNARYKRMSHEEIEELWPDADLDGLSDSDLEKTRKAGRTPAMYDRTNEPSEQDDRPKVWQYEYYVLEPYWKVENPFLLGDPEFFQFILPDLIPVFGEQITAKQLNLTEDGFKKLQKMAKDLNIKNYASVRMTKKVWYRLIFVGDVELHHELNPVQDFTQKYVTGKRDETDGCWYGIVRPMKDPQLWANKFLSTLLYIYMHNSKGGLFIESDAVLDPEQLKRDYAKPGTAIVVNPGAIQNGKIKERGMSPLDSAAASIMGMAIDAIPAVTGVNPAVVAVSTQNRSNALEDTRIRQSATLLMDYFESMSQYRKEKGRLYVLFTREYLCQEERLIRISDEGQPAKFIELIQDSLADDYDVVSEEGALTISQKEETWRVLTQLFQGQGAIPTPLWKYAPIPANIANEVVQFQQQQQQQQAQMQQQQMAIEGQEVQAAAQKDTALAANAEARTNQVMNETRMMNMQGVAQMMNPFASAGQEFTTNNGTNNV